MNQTLLFIGNIFHDSDFIAISQNGRWSTFHSVLYIISNLLVWGAYFAIPVLIVKYLQSHGRKVRFNNLYILFAAFVLCNGAVFFFDAVSYWIPMFRLSTFLRFVTGIVSWITVYYIIKIIPIAFSLKPAQEIQVEVEKRTLAERQLRNKNELLLEAERTGKLGYCILDTKRKHLQISEMAYKLLDIPFGTTMTYEKLVEQIHPADVKFVEEAIKANLEANVFREFYFRVVTNKMEVKHLLMRGEVIKNARGEALILRGTIQDVSELRMHMLRIQQQNKRLKKIAWVQSHRMRSPVASILGMVELFNFDDPSDPMNAEILKNIKDLTENLDEIIHEVDELTRNPVDAR